MAPITGSRALQRGGEIEPPAGFEKRGRIPLPLFAVEVHRQKETSLVLHHGINTHDKIETPIVTPRKMPADYLVRDPKEAAIRAIGAFDARLFANPANP